MINYMMIKMLNCRQIQHLC